MHKSVYVVNGDQAYYALFRKLGFSIVTEISSADLVCFTGGADVSPDLYGDKQHAHSFVDRRRDMAERERFFEAQALSKPMVGICRGAQFLNVMSGGRMYQHVSKHATHAGHEIIDVESGETILVSSTHHQMMMPSPDALLVAYSTLKGEREWYDGEVFRKDVSDQDIEVVFYAETDVLCFQPHPEFTSKEYSRMTEYFGELLYRFLDL